MNWKARELWSDVDASDTSVVTLSGKGDQTVVVNTAVYSDGNGWLVEFEA